MDELSLDDLIALVGAERFERACACAFDPALSGSHVWPEDLAEVPHQLANRVWYPGPGEVVHDGQIPERLDLALELYRRMPCYATAMYMVVFAERVAPGERRRFWAGCRSLLEEPDDRIAGALAVSLGVDYFMGPIAEEAWSETTCLPESSRRRPRVRERADLEAAHRRVTRVLGVAGPVPWGLKEPLLERLVAELEWHTAVFRCLYASVFEIHGDIDRAAARRLFSRLRLPAPTEEWAQLAAALSARS
jgi:hypothetical protein